VSENPKSIEINYDNNIGNIKFELVAGIKNIQHGLFKTIDNGSLHLDTGSAELPRAKIASLALGCDISSSNVNIGLRVNNKVDFISVSSPIKIYKIINDSGQWKLAELSGASYSGPTIDGDYNNYSISLPSGINAETKLVIMYKSMIPTDNIRAVCK